MELSDSALIWLITFIVGITLGLITGFIWNRNNQEWTGASGVMAVLGFFAMVAFVVFFFIWIIDVSNKLEVVATV